MKSQRTGEQIVQIGEKISTAVRLSDPMPKTAAYIALKAVHTMTREGRQSEVPIEFSKRSVDPIAVKIR